MSKFDISKVSIPRSDELQERTIRPEEVNLHPWWECAPVPSGHDWFMRWAQQGLVARSIQGGDPVFKGRGSGIVGKKAKKILENIETFQLGRRVFEKIRPREKLPSEVGWAWSTGAIEVDYWDGEQELRVEVVTTDKEVAERVIDLVRRYVAPPKPEGKVYIIGSSQFGPEFYSLGVASVPLERGNYDDDVMAVYDEIVKDLTTSSPAGRLSIFDGPPGTGKTFLIRALLKSVPDAMFVFVLPNMMDQLASPSLIPLLIRRKQSQITKGPIVFILEDGDNVLTPRGKENLSLISTLLNMTSGILGSMLDIRAVATTNSPKADIDPALMRKGRLSQHVTVGPLERARAASIYKRLTGKELPRGFVKSPVLADVYHAAREAGWRPKSSSKGVTVTSDGELKAVAEAKFVDSRQFGEDFVIYPGELKDLLS